MTPNERLMDHYGTRDVFEKKKTAGSLLSSLLPALIAVELSREGHSQEQQIHDRDRHEDRAVRDSAMAEMSQATSALRHTGVPILVPAGYDGGMVRIAMIATQAGAELAKEAGIGSMVSSIVPAVKNMGQKAVGAVGGVLGKAEKTVASAGQEAPGLLGKAKGKLLGPLGLKTNALLVGGTLGAGWLANKAVHKATGELGRESVGSPVYGGGRLGYNPPSTVNDWGVPQ